MLNEKTLTALAKCLESFVELSRVLGAAWTVALVAVVIGGVAGLLWYRARKMETGFNRVIDAKDDMIKQLNDQNRELRVQNIVVGKLLTYDEAVTLVYGSERAPLAKAKNP